MKKQASWLALLILAQPLVAADSKVAETAAFLALKKGELYLEDMGRIDIAKPLLLSINTNFVFKLTNDAQFFFNDARTNLQGASARFTQSQMAVLARVEAQKSELAVLDYAEQMRQHAALVKDYEEKQGAIREALKRKLDADLAAANTNQDAIVRTNAMAQAYKAYADALPGGNTAPTFSQYTNANLPSINTSVPEARMGAFTNANFLGYQALLNHLGATPTIPVRQALVTAAGDNLTRAIFEAMGDPTRSRDYEHNRAFFGFTTVSVEPGRRTRENYSAQVSVSASVEYVDARLEVVLRLLADGAQTFFTPPELVRIAHDYGYDRPGRLERALATQQLKLCNSVRLSCELKNNGADEQQIKQLFESIPSYKRQALFPDLARAGHIDDRAIARQRAAIDASVAGLSDADHPLRVERAATHLGTGVTVLGPLNESENFDLAESTRQQREFALQLAGAYEAAGQKANAAGLFSYAKRIEEDAHLRRAFNAVNSFSSTEGAFGFEIGPRPLTPKAVSGKAKPELQRQSFPALLLVQVGRGGSDVRFRLETNTTDVIKVRVMEPAIRLIQHRRWLASSRPWCADGLGPVELKNVVRELDTLAAAGRSGGASNPDKVWANRAEELSAQLAGGLAHVRMPVESVVEITDKELEAKSLVVEKVIQPDKISLAADGGATNRFLLKFSAPLPKDAAGRIVAGGGQVYVKDHEPKGQFLEFTAVFTNFSANTAVAVGAAFGGSNVFHTSTLPVEARPSVELAIKDVLLPQQVILEGNPPVTVSVVVELNQKSAAAVTNCGVYPGNVGTIVSGSARSAGNLLLFDFNLTNSPSGGAIAVTITNHGSQLFSRPIAVKARPAGRAEEPGRTTTMNFQINSNGVMRTYALTAPAPADDRLLASITELARKDIEKPQTNTVILPVGQGSPAK